MQEFETKQYASIFSLLSVVSSFTSLCNYMPFYLIDV